MGFIDRELEKLSAALRSNPTGNRRAELYAAQQALSWASDPGNFKSPVDLIEGIPEGSEDCPGFLRPPQS